MKRIFVTGIVLMVMFVSATSLAEEPGKDYTLLNPEQLASTDQVEVVEFFSYECGKCFVMNQSIAQWYSTAGGDVGLIRVPVIFNDSMAAARLYYALQSLGLADKLHGEIYQQVQIRNLHLAEVLSDKMGRQTYINALAVDPGKFEDAWNSTEVERRLADSENILQRYQIGEIPSLVVDGKYRIAGLTPDRTMQVLRDLVQLVRVARGTAKSATGEPVAPDGVQRKTNDKTHCLELQDYREIAKCTGEM
jgi:thiol:disulfide interchange protein DsbA